MAEPIFDHDRLDVYRVSIDYVASSFKIAKDLNGLHRHARDQWLRPAQSIPLNIAEGNGKRSLKDRNRFLDIARGSALECAAIQDVLAATDGIDDESHGKLKRILKRVVSMLTRLIARGDVAREDSAEYNANGEYEYRGAEYEEDKKPEQMNWQRVSPDILFPRHCAVTFLDAIGFRFYAPAIMTALPDRCLHILEEMNVAYCFRCSLCSATTCVWCH